MRALGDRRPGRGTIAAWGVFLALVLACVAAPLWAEVAGTGPEETHETKRIEVDGERVDVVAPDGVPIGPRLGRQYLLGADDNGRDIAVRLLYGGRTSLLIGIVAALLTALISVGLALLAGYAGGLLDAVIGGAMDVVWAYPVVLLGIALGTALASGGLTLGPVEIAGTSKLIPIAIIAIVYVPYMARPLRGEVLALRGRDFVAAARAAGAGPVRVMVGEILPNLATTIVALVPLMAANAILLESALSFVGAGVQSGATWGTMIADGVDAITSAAHLTIVPGLMLALTVIALNGIGDGTQRHLAARGGGAR